MTTQNLNLDKVDWKTATPTLILHTLAFAGLFYFPITWKAVALVAGSHYLRMWWLSSFSHRYFSHRSFKTSRPFQFLMALGSTLTTQNGLLWWAANHRHHHRFSDLPEDLHSPSQKGFWWGHMGWVLSYRSNETKWDLVKDLTKYPEILWLNRHWLLVNGIASAVVALCFGLQTFYWFGIVGTVVLYHGTFTINSLSHMWGTRRYKTTDTSRNNFLLAMITMGEGWHNNHHHYMSSARQGFFWWEIDPSFYLLKGMEKLGLVWDIREPPAQVLVNETVGTPVGVRIPQPQTSKTVA
ncbi:MAG: acyl-CoA desaturase [Bdellovibrionota bacterium]